MVDLDMCVGRDDHGEDSDACFEPADDYDIASATEDSALLATLQVALSALTQEDRNLIKDVFEKYIGIALHPAIISVDDFNAVQQEKARRSNIERTDSGIVRKSTHYSAKRDALQSSIKQLRHR